MRANGFSSRSLFLLVLGGIASVYLVGSLWLSRFELGEHTDAALVSGTPQVEATPGE
jgi:hypothetical protein